MVMNQLNSKMMVFGWVCNDKTFSTGNNVMDKISEVEHSGVQLDNRLDFEKNVYIFELI